MTRLLVICNPDNRRTSLLAQAARGAGWRLERFPYRSLLENFARAWPHLQRRADRADVLRLDSPAEDAAVEKQLLQWGLEAAAGLPANARLSTAEINSLEVDRGRILCPRQSYLGYASLLRRLRTQLPGARWMNEPETVLAMFDKPTTVSRLQRARIPTPDTAGVVTSWPHLREAADERGWDKVFAKIANGSSASGVAAIDLQGDVTAQTSVELVEDAAAPGGVRLYNSLRTQRYQGEAAVGRLIDLLAGHRLQLERWLPKAQTEGREFDLRVVVTAGEPTHWVMRVSRHSPMTNLHLGNERGDLPALRAKLQAVAADCDGRSLEQSAWEEIEQLCRDTAAVFPEAHYAGLDVMLSPAGLRILECNAYGDLLPGVTDDQGLKTHQRQLQDWPP